MTSTIENEVENVSSKPKNRAGLYAGLVVAGAIVATAVGGLAYIDHRNSENDKFLDAVSGQINDTIKDVHEDYKKDFTY